MHSTKQIVLENCLCMHCHDNYKVDNTTLYAVVVVKICWYIDVLTIHHRSLSFSCNSKCYLMRHYNTSTAQIFQLEIKETRFVFFVTHIHTSMLQNSMSNLLLFTESIKNKEQKVHKKNWHSSFYINPISHLS